MDQTRKVIGDIQAEEERLLDLHRREAEAGARRTLTLVLATLVFGTMLLGVSAFRLRRELRLRMRAESTARDAVEELRELSLTDALTGLSNRRGFLLLAEQRLKLAYRLENPVVLLYMDLDNMKPINDSFGHQHGDQALIDTAGILRQTFRETDIIARLGGDEFAVLAMMEAQDSAGLLADRLRSALTEHNRAADRPYALSLSIGVAEGSVVGHPSLDDLLVQADQSMYHHKKQRRVQHGVAA